jgi:lipid-A-disaccharide synthase
LNPSHPTIALVAGEASGDQLGGAILSQLRAYYPQARFVGIGGEQMRSQGMDTWWDCQELAVFGLFEVLEHFPRLYKIRRKLRQRLLEIRPDVFVGIDAPDFNLGLEIALKSRDISTIQYVSPTVWAWRKRRVRKIARAADLVLCLFPFEPGFYRNAGVAATYVGHPMADLIDPEPDPQAARDRLGLESSGKVVALLPGSRAGEVSKLAAPMIEAARILASQRPELHFISAMANATVRNLFEAELRQAGNPDIRLFDGRPLDVMAAADVVLVASGTAALETMLVNRPMVVCYRLSKSTSALVKLFRLLNTEYVSLPNILADEHLVPELLQQEATGARMAEEVLRWLNDKDRRASVQARFAGLHQQLRCDAGAKAAEAIHALLNTKT